MFKLLERIFLKIRIDKKKKKNKIKSQAKYKAFTFKSNYVFLVQNACFIGSTYIQISSRCFEKSNNQHNVSLDTIDSYSNYLLGISRLSACLFVGLSVSLYLSFSHISHSLTYLISCNVKNSFKVFFILLTTYT